MKKRIAIISIFIIILVSLVISSIVLVKRTNIQQIIDKSFKEENSKDITYKYYGWKEGKAEVLITFVDNEEGISKLEPPDGRIINIIEKNRIAIDYEMELNKPYIFKMYNKNGELYEKEIIIDMKIMIYKEDEGYGYKKVAIDYINDIDENCTKQYKVGESGDWKTYTEAFLIWDYDLTYEQKVDDDETITIYGKLTSGDGTTYEESLKIDIDTTIKAKVDTIEADDLIKAVQSEDYSIGMFSIKIKDEEYDVHAYEFDKSQKFDINAIFGIADDVATATSYAKRMIVVKINGDLTIEASKTLTTYASENGYGGPKGMFIYCTGTITNNGIISMTARGAKAEGQNVYLWENIDKSCEYIPKNGGNGGESVSSSSYWMLGINGQNGVNRQTGGGASGLIWTSNNRFGKTGAGAAGTSYSGGSGGGAVDCGTTSGNLYGGAGESNGGSGGYGVGNASAVSGRFW